MSTIVGGKNQQAGAEETPPGKDTTADLRQALPCTAAKIFIHEPLAGGCGMGCRSRDKPQYGDQKDDEGGTTHQNWLPV